MNDIKRTAFLSLLLMAIGFIISHYVFHGNGAAQSVVKDWWMGVAKYIGIGLMTLSAVVTINSYINNRCRASTGKA